MAWCKIDFGRKRRSSLVCRREVLHCDKKRVAMIESERDETQTKGLPDVNSGSGRQCPLSEDYLRLDSLGKGMCQVGGCRVSARAQL